MAVSLTLRPEQIARAECILADGLESIQAVKKRTGADILFNWPIYDFDGGTIRSRPTSPRVKRGRSHSREGSRYTAAAACS